MILMVEMFFLVLILILSFQLTPTGSCRPTLCQYEEPSSSVPPQRSCEALPKPCLRLANKPWLRSLSLEDESLPALLLPPGLVSLVYWGAQSPAVFWMWSDECC